MRWGTLAPVGLLLVAVAACGAERPDLSGYGCEDLASEIAAASKGEYMQVDNIDELSMVQDHRDTFAMPKGEGTVLVLRCQGQADWKWGREPVVLDLGVNQAGDTWLNWEPTF